MPKPFFNTREITRPPAVDGFDRERRCVFVSRTPNTTNDDWRSITGFARAVLEQICGSEWEALEYTTKTNELKILMTFECDKPDFNEIATSMWDIAKRCHCTVEQFVMFELKDWRSLMPLTAEEVAAAVAAA